MDGNEGRARQLEQKAEDLRQATPIILDLDGDGIEISADLTVAFDVDGDGYLEQTAWAASDDGFLVIDLDENGELSGGNGDGVIDEARELAFTEWLSDNDGATDLEALSHFDSRADWGGNGDDVLNDLDEIWADLRVWQDLDLDGTVDEGELRHLEEWGISEINLFYSDESAFDFADDDITIFGSTLFGTSTFVHSGEEIDVEGDTADPFTGQVGDIALAYNQFGWRQTETSSGYEIEFETGETLRYGELDDTTSGSLNLYDDSLDGAFGDDRNNTLTGGNSAKSLQISGGAGNDAITGGHADDFISGDAGADRLDGAGGNDVVFFDANDTVVRGGSGFDTAIGTGEGGVSLNLAAASFEAAYGTDVADTFTAAGFSYSVTINGNDGDDDITGGDTDDILSGDGGNDVIRGNRGSDTGIGGTDVDTIYGGIGGDLLLGGDGDDVLYGEDGDDSLFGGNRNDTVHGDNGDDYIDGGEGGDALFGGSGDDAIFGGMGYDTLRGGSGDDYLDGGGNHDTIYTGSGDDTVVGGHGNDTIHIDGWGDKEIIAGHGDDVIHVGFFGWAQHHIMAGQGHDTVHLTGHASDYQIDDMFRRYSELVSNNDGAPDDCYRYELGIREWRITDQNGQAIYVQNVEEVSFADGTSQILDGSDRRYLVVNGSVSPGGISSLGHRYATPDAADSAYDNSDTFHVIETIQAGPSHGTTLTINGETVVTNRMAGDDTVEITNSGADSVRLGSGDDYLALSDGDDYGTGWSGADVIDGGGGDDSVVGNGGSDRLLGGDGADTVSGGSGSDVLEGGAGADIIHAGSGGDIVYGGEDDDAIYGEGGSDFLYGNEGDDLINGGEDADVIYGGAGSDDLEGDDGADRLFGDNGADNLYGQYGDDSLNGGAGNDYLFGGSGNDQLIGDGKDENDNYLTGDDFLSGYNGQDYLDGGLGNDRLRGGNDDDYLLGGDGDDDLQGQNDNDVLEGGAGADLIHGGAGVMDVASYAGSDAAVTVSLETLTANGGHATGDTLVDIEWLEGSDHDDTLTGDTQDNRLFGNDGNDDLGGLDGRDVIYGGAGEDTIAGGRDEDDLYGGEGNDTIYGNSGDDYLFGNEGDDVLSGGDGDDLLNGGAGNDTLLGGAGNDIIFYEAGDNFWHDNGIGRDVGGSGIDTLVVEDGSRFVTGNLASYGFENFQGGDGDDRVSTVLSDTADFHLDGGAGDDELTGANGSDTLVGGTGNDTLTGRGGADMFTFGDGFGTDVIVDFEVGTDIINLSDVTAIADWSDLSTNHLRQDGDDALIEAGDHTVRLTDVAVGALTESDFGFGG